MGKLILFYFLWRMTGNPILAIFILLIIFYVMDRRYVGFFPSITKPFQMGKRIANLKKELQLNPHHMGNKHELARILIEKKHYAQALPYIQEVYERIQDSPEIQYELGLCLMKTGKVDQGEEFILKALKTNPMLKYGEPYLEMVEVFSHRNTKKALDYLDQVRQIHSSSVETYYRLGMLYLNLGLKEEARSAFQEAMKIYQSIPKYLRRKERKWALYSRLKLF